jgi:hypothetical protein
VAKELDFPRGVLLIDKGILAGALILLQDYVQVTRPIAILLPEAHPPNVGGRANQQFLSFLSVRERETPVAGREAAEFGSLGVPHACNRE